MDIWSLWGPMHLSAVDIKKNSEFLCMEYVKYECLGKF